MTRVVALLVALAALIIHAPVRADCEVVREISAQTQRIRIELCHEGRGMLSVVVLDAQGSEVVRLHDHIVNTWAPTSLRTARLVDVNHDGARDLLICARAMSGAGPEGAREFPICDFWLSSGSSFARAENTPEWTRQETHLMRLQRRLQRLFARHAGRITPGSYSE